MPIPIVLLEPLVCQYTQAFRRVFSRPQFQHFVTVLLGLLASPERRTLRGLLQPTVGTRSLSAVSRFLSAAPWIPGRLAQAWVARFRQQLLPLIQAERQRLRAQRSGRRGRPPRPRVPAFLIFDDSTIAKHVQGKPPRCMQGVGQHYSTTQRKVVEGHSLVAGLLVVLGRRCPLVLRLYRQKRVAQAEGKPFRSKVELVTEAIGEFQPLAGTVTHVLVDAWYTCRGVWRAAAERGFLFTGGLRTNRWLRLAGPEGWRKVRLSTYVAGLQPQDFVPVDWRGRTMAAHLVRTYVYHLGACQVLVVKERPQAAADTARCYVTSDLKADVAAVAGYAAQRWDIETWLEDTKRLLGLDHYQVTSDIAMERYWHLVACCYLYLDELRAQLIAEGRLHATIGDALRYHQKARRQPFLQWLRNEFSAGATPHQVEQLLAA
ncbi:MAG: transposase [Dehalococcoidia bacterium]